MRASLEPIAWNTSVAVLAFVFLKPEVPTCKAALRADGGQFRLPDAPVRRALQAQRIEGFAFLVLLEQELAPGVQTLTGFGGGFKYACLGGDAPDVG
jgi:hypothetical protein